MVYRPSPSSPLRLAKSGGAALVVVMLVVAMLVVAMVTAFVARDRRSTHRETSESVPEHRLDRAPAHPAARASADTVRALLPRRTARAQRSPVDPPPVAPALTAEAMRDEAAIMARLRELGASDEEESVRLAREGNQRYPGGADVPERTWFLVKSLAGLMRSEEARAEAQRLVEAYPGNQWAEDVRRHMLDRPPDREPRAQ